MKKHCITLILAVSMGKYAGASVCSELQCQNGGICVEKEANFSGHHFIEDADGKESHRGASNFYCQCISGWAGATCEVPYESCYDTHMC